MTLDFFQGSPTAQGPLPPKRFCLNPLSHVGKVNISAHLKPMSVIKNVVKKQCLFIPPPITLAQTTSFCMQPVSVMTPMQGSLVTHNTIDFPVWQTGYNQEVFLTCKGSPAMLTAGYNYLASPLCNISLSPPSGTIAPGLVQDRGCLSAHKKKAASDTVSLGLSRPRFPRRKLIKASEQVMNLDLNPRTGKSVCFATSLASQAARSVLPVLPPTNVLTSRLSARPSPDTDASLPDTDSLIPAVSFLPCNSTVSPSFHNTLARCLEQWKRCNPNQWVLRTVARGYRLQFANQPPLSSRVIYTRARGLKADTLREEIGSLLRKGAIVELPRDQSRLGFWSRYFLVQKKGGGLRPILDLRCLNKHLKKFKFKMLTSQALLRSVRQGDFHCSVDLKDAYQHVQIYPPHRKFLRFAFEGRLYEYTVLPFGLSLSPRVFVKVTEAAIAPLRQQGIRLANYVDDWMISSCSSLEASLHTQTVLAHLTALGFNINFEKSMLIPAQQISFIGMLLDSNALSARLAPERVDRFLACLNSFQLDRVVLYKECMKLTGLMASAVQLLRLGRFYMRPFQRWVLSLRIPSRQGYKKVVVSQTCMDTLVRWRDPAFLSSGVTMGEVVSHKVITTDASRLGWGAVHEGRSARGLWTPQMLKHHINFLELMAVFLALKKFEPLILGCHVLVRTDNTTALYYINKQGGLSSRPLDQLARRMTLWCERRLKSIRACHVPGLQNGGADLLSRREPRYEDWSLHPSVVRQIFVRFGQPRVDLFASHENAKCPLYFAVRGTSPLGVDAFASVWPRGLLYAFPPLELILPTLERVRRFGLEVLLIAPFRGTWRSLITPLLYKPAWQLPQLRDLLRQAGDEIFHPDPQGLNLWVWPVRGRIC